MATPCKCCVPSCAWGVINSKCRVSFHLFPRDEEQRKAWIAAVFRNDMSASDGKLLDRNAAVCSNHFLDADVLWLVSGNRGTQMLKYRAVPKVFPWSGSQEDVPASKASCIREESSMSNGQRGTKKLDVKQWQQEHEFLSRNYSCFTEGEKLEAATHYVQQLQRRTLELQSQQFCLERFSSDPHLISFYTGFPSYQHVCDAFLALQPTAERMTRCSLDQCGRLDVIPVGDDRAFSQEDLALIDQFFLFLVKLKQGSVDLDLAHRFGVSITCVRQVVSTWANYLYTLLGAMPIWPSRPQVDESMPACVKTLYSNTRVILHSVELRIQDRSLPSDSNSLSGLLDTDHKETWSCKGLIGITPAGGVSFISELFKSPISNKNLTIRSKLPQLLEPGDQVMVNGDFPIQSELNEVGASLILVPPFQDSEETQCLGHLRSTIARCLQRVTEYRIFDRHIPLSIAVQVWTVCCLLTNFKSRIL